MDRPFRVALLANEHPALGHAGGVGTYTESLAAALGAAGVTVLTLVADDQGLVSEIDKSGVRVVGSWRGPVALRPLTAARILDDRLGSFQPDVIEAPNWGGLGSRLNSRTPLVVRLSTPVMAIAASDRWRRMTVCLHHAWEQRCVRRAALVIADSVAVGRLCAPSYGREADVVIPHPFQASNPPLPIPNGTGILAVGRLEHRKGTDLLLAAWRQLRHIFPNWTLHLVGADRGGFGARSLDAYGRDCVVVHGRLPADELASVARTCPVAVIPSRWESFGMAVLEAWNRGQVVLASDAGGLSEVVGDAGVVVPHGDPAALGEALAGLIGDPARRRSLAASGSQRLRDAFAPAACAAATLAAYSRAIDIAARDCGPR